MKQVVMRAHVHMRATLFMTASEIWSVHMGS